MPRANPEQLRQQEHRRETVRNGIFQGLLNQPRTLRRWLNHQSISPSTHRREPDSIVAVVNLHQDHVTSLRTIDHQLLRQGDTQWLTPQALRCPNSRIDPQEATLFCIMAEPLLKAIALTPAGWNDCWVLQTAIDDYEDNPTISPLSPITVAASKAITPLPYKVVLTPPQNLMATPA